MLQFGKREDLNSREEMCNFLLNESSLSVEEVLLMRYVDVAIKYLEQNSNNHLKPAILELKTEISFISKFLPKNSIAVARINALLDHKLGN